jgi:hypothetical protein
VNAAQLRKGQAEPREPGCNCNPGLDGAHDATCALMSKDNKTPIPTAVPVAEPTMYEYRCPACDVTERVTQYVQGLVHRHNGEIVMLVKVRRK